MQWQWSGPYELPERGVLVPKLSELAHGIPYQADDGREDATAAPEVLRVGRGGSWNNNHGNARCSYRNRNHPNNRNNNNAFRVVSRPSRPSASGRQCRTVHNAGRPRLGEVAGPGPGRRVHCACRANTE